MGLVLGQARVHIVGIRSERGLRLGARERVVKAVDE